jgi:hypothetical protein
MSENIVTSDLADFGARELYMLSDLLKIYAEKGLPEGMSENGVAFMLNRNSGEVFLTNEDYHVAMDNNGSLEQFYSTPYNGIEGFFSDLIQEYPNMHDEDREYVRDVSMNREVSEVSELIDVIIENATELSHEDIEYAIKMARDELETDQVKVGVAGQYTGTLLLDSEDSIFIKHGDCIVEAGVGDIEMPEINVGDKLKIKLDDEGILSSIKVVEQDKNKEQGR